MADEPHRAVIWFVVAILIIMLALQLAANVHFKVEQLPPIVLANYYKNMTVPSDVLLNDMLQLPVHITNITNDSNLRVFVSNGMGIPLKQAILELLAYNASKIAPGPYWTVADLAGALEPSNITYKLYNTTTYNGTNITLYHLWLPFYNASPFNVSYPPSDRVNVNSPVLTIVNQTSITTYVYAIYYSQPYLAAYYSYQNGNNIYEYYYYDMVTTGTAYLYANDKVINSENFQYTFYWYGNGYSINISGTVYVINHPEKVFAIFNIWTTLGFYSYTYQQGNYTYHVYVYYPKGPHYSSRDYTFNWYEYNISVPVQIQVFNGTNPVTVIGNHTYHTRTINADFSYLVWSFGSENITTPLIVTYDTIKIVNNIINRTWIAGSIEIITKPYRQQSGTTINYYLTAEVSTSKIAKQPEWVFKHIPQNQVYEHNFALEFLQGPAYLYALNKYLTSYFANEKYANFTAISLFMSLVTNLRQVNENKTLQPAEILANYSGPAWEIRNLALYFASFSIPWLNYSIPNATFSIIGPIKLPFNYTKVIVDNSQGLIISTFIYGLANITKIENGTYTFYKWFNWSNGAIEFKQYEYANYSVEFL